MNYSLKRKDTDLLFFSMRGKYVDKCIISKEREELLPLPLKRLVKPGYASEFVDMETDEYYRLNDEGCILVDNWLSNREIPVNRINYDAYIEKGSSPREWLLKNNGYSFTDCYWIEAESEELEWADIEARLSALDPIFATKDENNFYRGQNATLGGQLEKFWYKKDDNVMLCKRTDMQYDVLSAREIVGSSIYEKQNTIPFCKYKFVYNREGDIVGCTCPAFTDTSKELVTSYDLLEEYNLTQSDDVWEHIIQLAANYGVSEKDARDYMDLQAMVDYLITNRDRHQGNIGFLRDADTLQFLSPAPIFDNGSSKHQEGEYPENITNTTVNGLYRTELDVLQHVKNFVLLDISKLPTKEEIGEIFGQCRGITKRRKAVLENLYAEKVDFLRLLQQKFRDGENIAEYIETIKSTTEPDSDDFLFLDYDL